MIEFIDNNESWTDFNPESIDAFESIRESLPEQRAKVLAFIKSKGADGATVDEIAIGLRTLPSCISGRVTELKKAGRVVKNGTRPTRSGCSAGVMVVKKEAA